MIEKINDLLKRVEEFKPQAAAEIEEFRVRLLGRKGQLNDILDEFKTVAPEMKRELGQKINTLKTRAIEKINALKTELENSENNTADSGAWIDMSRPGSNDPVGSRHPISLVKNEIVSIFARLLPAVLRPTLRRILPDGLSAAVPGPLRRGDEGCG